MKCKQCGRRMKIVKFELPARVYRCITGSLHAPPRTQEQNAAFAAEVSRRVDAGEAADAWDAIRQIKGERA